MRAAVLLFALGAVLIASAIAYQADWIDKVWVYVTFVAFGAYAIGYAAVAVLDMFVPRQAN